METTINLLILILISTLVGGFFSRIVKIHPSMGYILSGFAFGILSRNLFFSVEGLFEIFHVLTALLIFTLGFEFSFSNLNKINNKILGASLIFSFVNLTLLYFIFIFRNPADLSLFLAGIFSLSSIAFTLKLLEEKSMVTNFPGVNIVLFLFIQSILLIPLVLLMQFIFKGGYVLPILFFEYAILILKSAGVILLIFIFNKLILKNIYKHFIKYPAYEFSVLSTVLLVVASIGLLNFVGLPNLLSAFFAGVLVSDERKNVAVFSHVRSVRDILFVIFLVCSGMLIESSFLVKNFPTVLGISSVLALIRFTLLNLIFRILKFLPAASIFMSSHLVLPSEIAVVIGFIAFRNHYINQIDFSFILSIFVLSVLLFFVFAWVLNLVTSRSKKMKILKKIRGDMNFFTNPTLKGIRDHVIICGQGRVGGQVRNILDMADVPYVVLDYNKNIIDDLNQNMKNALYGDPADESTLNQASIKYAKILVISLTDSGTQKALIKIALKLNPRIVILCRSEIEEDKFELVNLGVNTIVYPDFEAGLRIGKKVLELFNFSDQKTYEYLKKLRKFHLVH